MEQEKLVELVKELRERSGCGLLQCKEAIEIFEDNLNQAYEYLRMRGTAVCRRRPDGLQWQKQDYIDYVRTNIK